MTFCTRICTFGLLGVTAASLAACGASQPPRTLLDARAAYAKAASGPAAQLRPDTLTDAHNTLNAAERAYASDADDTDVNTISYVSVRKSETAEIRPSTCRTRKSRRWPRRSSCEFRSRPRLRLRLPGKQTPRRWREKRSTS